MTQKQFDKEGYQVGIWKKTLYGRLIFSMTAVDDKIQTDKGPQCSRPALNAPSFVLPFMGVGWAESFKKVY